MGGEAKPMGLLGKKGIGALVLLVILGFSLGTRGAGPGGPRVTIPDPTPSPDLRFQYEILGPRPNELFVQVGGLSYEPSTGRLLLTDPGRQVAHRFNRAAILEESVGGMPFQAALGTRYLYAVGTDRRSFVVMEGSVPRKTVRFDFLAEQARVQLGRLVWQRGLLYVLDVGNQQVLIFDEEGTFLRRFGREGRSPGEFLAIEDLAVDRQGRMYVTDTKGFPVQVFDEQGRLLFVFGTRGLLDSSFTLPTGIAVDRFDQIWVTDTQVHKVKVLNHVGQLVRVFGGFGQGPGLFIRPIDIALDDFGKVYVLEEGNRRLQIFQLANPARPFLTP